MDKLLNTSLSQCRGLALGEALTWGTPARRFYPGWAGTHLEMRREGVICIRAADGGSQRRPRSSGQWD